MGRPDHYFTERPGATSRPQRIRLDLSDVQVELETDAGVFSPDHVDPGTKLLLAETPPPPPGATVVDLGCGYGPIAIAAAIRSPDADVVAVDVNERARALCRANADRLGLDNVEVIDPDDFSLLSEGPSEGVSESALDMLLSNPPIRIGKRPLRELLTMWLDRLSPDGAAWLVVSRHLGSDSLATWLERDDRTVERIASRQGYRVLRVGGRG